MRVLKGLTELLLNKNRMNRKRTHGLTADGRLDGTRTEGWMDRWTDGGVEQQKTDEWTSMSDVKKNSQHRTLSLSLFCSVDSRPCNMIDLFRPLSLSLFFLALIICRSVNSLTLHRSLSLSLSLGGEASVWCWGSINQINKSMFWLIFNFYKKEKSEIIN